MSLWEEKRDAFILANEYGEVPNDDQVFFDMLRAGEFDITLLTGEGP